MEITTLPARAPTCSWAVVAAPSQGVASTTTSQSAAASLSPGEIGNDRSGHLSLI